jgi:hypothetical protein
MALEVFHRDRIWCLHGTVRQQPVHEQPVYESTRTGGRKTADAIRTKKENDLLDASVSGQEVTLRARATALVRAAPPHLRPLLVFIISVGCRAEEALMLDWLDLDLGAGSHRLAANARPASRG